MKKKIISAAAFLLIGIVMFGALQELLKPKWGDGTAGAHETTNANGFYSEPEQSLDVLMFGSSYCFFGVSPLKMWEEYGFASYVRGSANQSIFLTYYTLKDALKDQTPEVVVIEIGQMAAKFDPGTEDEWIARRGLDYLRMSDVKLEAICDLDLEGNIQSRMSYVMPLLRYHSRWKELNQEDFEYYTWEEHNYTKGQYIGVSIFDFQWPEGFMAVTEECAEFPEDNVEYLNKIVALCKEKGVELVFFKSPMDGWDYAKHNSIQKLADSYQVPFIDYNLPENIEATGIDDKTDFHYNQWHLRVTGAEKLSMHLGEFLQQTYELPDRRQDETYSVWNQDLQTYRALLKSKGL